MVHDKDHLEGDRAFGHHPLYHVHLLHRGGVVAHGGGQGDPGRLSHRDLPLVGPAVVKVEPQLGIVDNGSHRRPHAQVVPGPNVPVYIGEFAGVGSGDGQVAEILLHLLQLPVIVHDGVLGFAHALLGGAHILLGVAHRVLGGGVVQVVEQLSLLHIVALADEQLQHPVARVGGDSGRVLGPSVAHAVDGALEGAVGDHLGHHLSQSLVAVGKYVFVQGPSAPAQNGGGQDQSDDAPDDLPALLLLLMGGGAFPLPGAGGRHGGRRRFHHGCLLFCHDIFLLVQNINISASYPADNIIELGF